MDNFLEIGQYTCNTTFLSKFNREPKKQKKIANFQVLQLLHTIFYDHV